MGVLPYLPAAAAELLLRVLLLLLLLLLQLLKGPALRGYLHHCRLQ